ncbi:MAG: SAM-dependent methyltransferase, partial [Methylotenera sp.]|nr:SAM-dependent methyltransferase [Methylotenera sp.]
LHILTRDGKLNQDSRRKLKQVYHLVNFIEPLFNEVLAKNDNPVLVDHGAGKSYLGFILYDLLLKQLDAGQVVGIETRAELVESSKKLALQLGFTRMCFEHLTVEESISSNTIPAQVDIVTALHACNTATDDAIQFGLKKHARYMVLVPCCQAEVASVLRQHKNESFGKTPLSEIWRHPIHTREFGSQITNVLRCLQLEAAGYSLTVTELVGWEHSMKNELIIAKYTGQPRKNASARIEEILNTLNLEMMKSRFLNG